MRRLSLPIWLAAFLVAALVFAQAASLAHAAEHGDEPHDHAGITCELNALSGQQLALLPKPPLHAFVIVLPEAAGPVPLIQRAWTRPPGRAPPPRGPPVFRL